MANPFKSTAFGRTAAAIAFTAIVSSTLVAGAVGPAFALGTITRTVVVAPAA